VLIGNTHKTTDMNNRIDLELIVRYLAGEATHQEEKDIEAWMKRNPENRQVIETFEQTWREKMNLSHPFNAEAAWSRLHKEMAREEKGSVHNPRRMQSPEPASGKSYRKQRPRAAWQFMRAAAAILLIGAGILFYVQHSADIDEGIPTSEVVTEPGERAQLQLSDGTHIRLNVDSKLTYPKDFEGGTRVVELSGEAYFDVARDQRPFYVKADGAVIRVIGTEFNVQSYAADQLVQVVVAKGRVGVRDADDQAEEVALERGDLAQLKLDGRGILQVSQDVDLDWHLGWLDNRMEFRDTPIEQVAAMLERWHKVEIRIADPGLADLRFTAEFQDESIREILGVLQSTLQLEYKIEERTVTLYREGDSKLIFNK